MSQYVYTGPDERAFLYPRAFTVQPKEVVEFPDDESPDPYFFRPVAEKPSPAPRADKE